MRIYQKFFLYIIQILTLPEVRAKADTEINLVFLFFITTRKQTAFIVKTVPVAECSETLGLTALKKKNT